MLPGNSATHLAPASRPVPPAPIAIVRMACPGAPGQDEFWQLVGDGRDETTEIPADQLDVEAFYDSRPGTPGETRSRWHGLIQDVEGFDAAFSGISPREAADVDPQQRLLMEVAQEAMEGAGKAPEQLAGSDTGVFIGGSSNDCVQLVGGDASQIDGIYMITGNASAERAPAGVSSFGISGTNVRLEEMLGRPGSTPANPPEAAHAAAHVCSQQALRDLAATYADFLAEADRAGQAHRCRLARGRRQREVNRRAARVPPGLHSIAAHRRRPSRDPLPIRRAR
jgi:acyl transferase domain-containing protein